MTRKKIIAVFTAVIAFLLPTSVWAISIVPRQCVSDDPNFIPDLNCMLMTFGNIAQLILAVTGGLTLLMFVYGGFMLLSSGGAEQRVTSGKNIIKSALIGLAIILLAGYLINFCLDRLGVGSEFRETPKSTSPSEEGGEMSCTSVPVGSACTESACGGEPTAGTPCGGPVEGATCQEVSGGLQCEGLRL